MNPDVFFKNFELLADAPNGVKKLRELILQLAVMGKLVPQNSEDEPASVLLGKIYLENEKLAKEKGISRSKLLPPLEEDEIPFEVPNTWEWVKLGNVCYQITDGTHHTPTYVEEGVHFLSVKDISSGILDFSNTRFISEEEHKVLTKRCNPEYEDLLLTKVGTTGIAKVIDVNKSFSIFVSLALLKFPKNLIYPYFLELMINSPFVKNQSISNTQGIGNKNLVLKYINNFDILLPPLAEQKRIVTKVDELMALCDKLEARRQKKQEIQSKLNNAALDRMLNAENQEEFEQHWQRICENFDLLYDNPENVEKLKQAILQLAVQGKLVFQNPEDEPASVLIEKIEADAKKAANKGNEKKLASMNSDNEFFKLPNSWEWIQLGKLLTFGPKNGYSPKPVDFVTNTKSLTLSATTSGKFRDDCFKYIDEKIENNSHLWLEENDILIQRGNSIEYVGIATVYKGSSHNFIYPDLMMKLRAHKNVNIDFLHIVLNSKFSRNYFAEKASGTSGSMPKINQNTVINLPIPLPPLNEQKRIVEKVEQLMGLCDELELKLRKEREDSEKLMETVVKGLLDVTAAQK